MHLLYPQSKDGYTLEELQHLTKALGFPRNIIEKNVPGEKFNSGVVTIKDFVEMCDGRYFSQDLHYTVNLKSGTYNAETLKKCALQVAQKVFSFPDLEHIRLAYEVYEDFDQRGMPLDVRTIIKAMKLCNRVVAPLKLSKKLRRLQVGYREKGRIQFCEFLDLLAFCNLYDEKAVHLSLVGATDKTSRNIYRIDEMKEVLLPKDDLLRNILDRQYMEEELQHDHPKLRSKFFKENPINVEDFHHQTKSAEENYKGTRTRLRHSARQIMRSKGGLSADNVIEKAASKATSTSKKARSTTATSSSSTSRNIVTPSRQSSVTIATTYRSAPVLSLNLKEKLKPRAHSSPPVVNDTSRRDFQNRVNDLKFNIATVGQRWRNHMLGEISKYIYDSDEVLDRLRKPPPAPGVHRRRTRTQTRPSPRFTQRLSAPGPMLPRHHVAHCDAIAQGYGDDDHARTLQRHGVKAQRAHKQRLIRDDNITKRPGFLESILHTDSCDDEGVITEDEPELPINEEKKLDNEEANGLIVEAPSPSPSSPPPVLNLATKDSWHNARLNEALGLLHKDFSRIFIDNDDLKKTADKIDEDGMDSDGVDANRKGRSGVDIHSLITPPLQYILEDSEFEKMIKSKKDFIIPLEDLKDYEAGADWLALRRSIRRIRSRSASANSSTKQE